MSEKEKVEYAVNPLHLERALNHYRDYLLIKYKNNRFLTPAFMETLQNDIDQYQLFQSKRESNLVWKVPVKVIGDARTNNVDVTIQEHVLIKG
jgi:hypothetical protein